MEYSNNNSNSNVRTLPQLVHMSTTITTLPHQNSFTHVYDNHVNFHGHNSEKEKRRLTNEQLECLENSFQGEIKLEPHRKMRLSKELGLQPRQVAIWFQNRRARWKKKQVEIMYKSLKQQFHVLSKEKEELKQEVLVLKAILNEQAKKNQVSTGYTEINSGEKTVDSMSVRNAIINSLNPNMISDSFQLENRRTVNENHVNYNLMVQPPPWSTLQS